MFVCGSVAVIAPGHTPNTCYCVRQNAVSIDIQPISHGADACCTTASTCAHRLCPRFLFDSPSCAFIPQLLVTLPSIALVYDVALTSSPRCIGTHCLGTQAPASVGITEPPLQALCNCSPSARVTLAEGDGVSTLTNGNLKVTVDPNTGAFVRHPFLSLSLFPPRAPYLCRCLFFLSPCHSASLSR